MEEGRCWMVTKNRASSKCGEETWEEKAFAEDAAGMLGGCVWPPRSYSCNFCRREFRSAQALGGHMNVHRRDRARLKQFSSSQHPDPRHRIPSYKSSLSLSSHKEEDDAIIDTNPNTFCSLHPESELVSSFWTNRDKNVSLFCLHSDELTKDLPLKISKNHERPRSVISLSNDSATYEDNKDVDHRKRRKLDKSSASVIYKSDKDDADVDPPKFDCLDLELRLGGRPKVQ